MRPSQGCDPCRRSETAAPSGAGQPEDAGTFRGAEVGNVQRPKVTAARARNHLYRTYMAQGPGRPGEPIASVSIWLSLEQRSRGQPRSGQSGGFGKEVRCELTGKRTYDRRVAVCYLNGADIEMGDRSRVLNQAHASEIAQPPRPAAASSAIDCTDVALLLSTHGQMKDVLRAHSSARAIGEPHPAKPQVFLLALA